MRKFVINEEQLAAIIRYLATKPYNEVNQAVSMLHNLELLQEAKDSVKELKPPMK